MTCEDSNVCEKHGIKYMKPLYRDERSQAVIKWVCMGCHAGELASRDEYEQGIVNSLKEVDPRRLRPPVGQSIGSYPAD